MTPHAIREIHFHKSSEEKVLDSIAVRSRDTKGHEGTGSFLQGNGIRH